MVTKREHAANGRKLLHQVIDVSEDKNNKDYNRLLQEAVSELGKSEDYRRYAISLFLLIAENGRHEQFGRISQNVTRALKALKAIGDDVVAAPLRVDLASFLLEIEQYSAAHSVAYPWLIRSNQSGLNRRAGYRILATVATSQGDVERALFFLAQALSVRLVDVPKGGIYDVMIHCQASHVLAGAGQFSRASEELNRAESLLGSDVSPEVMSVILLARGRVCSEAGDYIAALDCYLEADQVACSRAMTNKSLRNPVWSKLEIGSPGTSIYSSIFDKHMRRAYPKHGKTRVLYRVRLAKASTLLACDDPKGAIGELRRLLSEWQSADQVNFSIMRQALDGLATAYGNTGDRSGANKIQALASKIPAHYPEVGYQDPRLRRSLFEGLGKLLRDLKNIGFTIYEAPGIRVICETGEITIGGKSGAPLTTQESLLFKHLCDNIGRTCTRGELYAASTGSETEYTYDRRSVDQMISNIRKKGISNKYLTTVRGYGYCLTHQ